MDYMAPVTSSDTATAFLRALNGAGLMYHPEESAYECLEHHKLGSMALNRINFNMAQCFAFLPDPCETALDIMNAAA